MGMIRAAASSLWTTAAAVIVLGGLAVGAGVLLFRVAPGSALALYFVVWWILLFAVLPFGVRSQAEAGDITAGTEPGAPSAPLLREKAIWTTLVADVVFLVTLVIIPLVL